MAEPKLRTRNVWCWVNEAMLGTHPAQHLSGVLFSANARRIDGIWEQRAMPIWNTWGLCGVAGANSLTPNCRECHWVLRISRVRLQYLQHRGLWVWERLLKTQGKHAPCFLPFLFLCFFCTYSCEHCVSHFCSDSFYSLLPVIIWCLFYNATVEDVSFFLSVFLCKTIDLEKKKSIKGTRAVK